MKTKSAMGRGLVAGLACAFSLVSVNGCGGSEPARIAAPRDTAEDEVLALIGPPRLNEIAGDVGLPADEVEPAEEHGPGTVVWGRRFGGPDMDLSLGVAVDPQDNIYLLGDFSGEVDFGTGDVHESAGLEDIFLLKLDPSGTPLWSKAFGGKSHDYADDLAVDAQGNVLLTGSFMDKIDLGGKQLKCKGVHDVFVAKLDPAGRHLWSRAYGDDQDQICLRVEPAPGGGAYVAGYFRGVVKLGRKRLRSYPDKTAFVAELDAEGKALWSEQFGHIFDYAYPGLARIEGGGVVLTSGSDPTIEFTGKKLKRVDRMMDLGVVVARYEADGSRLWRKRFGRGSDNMGTDVAFDPQGNIVVSGDFNGVLDFGGEELRAGSRTNIFVAELDPNGDHLWSRHFGGSRYQNLTGMVVGRDGAIYVTGQFDSGPLDFGGGPLQATGTYDVFLAALDDGGDHLFSRRFGGPGIQFPGGIALDSHGDLLLAGTFSDTIDFGGVVLDSAGFHDVFLVRIEVR